MNQTLAVLPWALLHLALAATTTPLLAQPHYNLRAYWVEELSAL